MNPPPKMPFLAENMVVPSTATPTQTNASRASSPIHGRRPGRTSTRSASWGSHTGARGEGGTSDLAALKHVDSDEGETDVGCSTRGNAGAESMALSGSAHACLHCCVVLEQRVLAVPGNLSPVSSKAEKFPARPGFGTNGRRCRVRANHFLVQVADKEIYHYDVATDPETRSRGWNRSIINQLIKLYKEHLDGRLPVNDGRKSLYTAGALPFKNKVFVVKLANAAKGNQRYVSISRSFFSQSFGHGGAIGNGVECWRGYYQSLLLTQMGLSLNIDISATTFYKAQEVMDFAFEYLNIRDASRPLIDRDRIKLKKALRGVRVDATHRKDKTIRYKITSISSAPLKELMFDQDGVHVSVVQYFKKQYNYSLKYINWPCLQAGIDSRPIYLPIITAGQRYSRKLNERQVSSILKMACERPTQRESNVLEIVNRNSYGNDDYSKEFGMKVMNLLALVDARVLPAPRLKYHDSGREKVCNPSVGQWNMINKRINLLNKSSYLGNEHGSMREYHTSARQDTVESAIRNIYGHSAQVLAEQGIKGKQLELLIIILPDVSGSYGKIKQLCETELGVITQCCLPKNVQKGGKQYLENLSLKINVKVGGRNTVLEDALYKRIPLLTDVPTIVFGADDYPPS
ncbi:protein argonaute 12-like [Hordeum vulgare]|nr:protein argonaute 12-like [Hordeum vulgare]